MYENLAILSIFVLLYSIIGGRLERTPISGAIVFTAFGLIFGPLGLGLLNLDVDSEGLRSIAELTLALVLFTDAANANLGVLKKIFRIPQRLLLAGLPLIILLGFALGVLVFDGLSLLEIAILATMLAPTDAALGKAVVSDKSVPDYIREGLNVESGLNDGICVPILLLFLDFAVRLDIKGGAVGLALKYLTEEIGIGIAVGIGLTVLGVWLINMFDKRGWITDTWRQLSVVALAMACFALAQSLGGSGFIASFTGGLLFGGIAKRYKHSFLLAAEGTGNAFALITWTIFGSNVVGKTVGFFSWEVLIYSLLSLTLVRMLPVFLTLTGMSLSTDEKLFMGWFGPRGLASIVFAIIVLNRNLPNGHTMAITVACTVLGSIVAHGLSSTPLIAALAAKKRGSQ
jgi:sodium/hydrogen antiporter